MGDRVVCGGVLAGERAGAGRGGGGGAGTGKTTLQEVHFTSRLSKA